MALFHINFYAKTLSKITPINVFLPNDLQPQMIEGNKHYERKTKTLYLLHGFSGNTVDWVAGGMAKEMSVKYNLAIVMPSGDNSFYLDRKGTGGLYSQFIGEELVSYVARTFGLSTDKEDVYIGGLSMGGFGAIYNALKYPQTFGKAFGLSPAMIIHMIRGMKPGTKDAIADYDYYTNIFGDLNSIHKSKNNPEMLIKQLKLKQHDIPSLYMACGTEDFLLDAVRAFDVFLKDEQIDVTYQESDGTHDWKFWNTYLEPAIEWMLTVK